MFFKAKLRPIRFSYLMAVFSLMFYEYVILSSRSEVLAILKDILSNVDFSIYGPPVPGILVGPS